MDPEMEEMPTANSGVDFRINKTQQGKHANYSTSDWSRKIRTLGQEEMDAIEQYGLYNLNEFIGKKPDADELAAIVAMFNDSVAGNPFDYESYGKYYKPYSNRNSENQTTSENKVTDATSNDTSDDGDAEETTVVETVTKVASSTGAANAQEIINRIKNRVKA